MMSNSVERNDSAAFPAIDFFNYECSDGILLPLISEYTWSKGCRGFLYLLGLLWCFLAVAIVADVFMCAIERITSKTKIVRVPDATVEGGIRQLEIKVWNDTVANLSLLALGTSAPEILLSVIEILGKGFKAGDLGPGTIVGSAAFNLFIISAICILSIPPGEVRRVANVKVFAVTAFSGIFAYVWLAIVLLLTSPGKVELWEAVLTLLFFPLLIVLAYFADKDFCMKQRRHQAVDLVGISMSGKIEELTPLSPAKTEDYEIMHLAKELGRLDSLPENEAAKIVANKILQDKSHNHGWYRINATRGMCGGRKLIPNVQSAFNDVYEKIKLAPEEGNEQDEHSRHIDDMDSCSKAIVSFSSELVYVMENEGRVRVGIKRSGKLDIPISTRVETINGTAVAGEDYVAINQTVNFCKNERLKEIFIEIVDDLVWEPDEFFYVKIHLEPEDFEMISIGSIPMCQIIIINDDEPGVLAFTKPSYVIKQSGSRAFIPISRIGGADGNVSVKWKTKDITAVDKKDYVGGEGVLTFDNQEARKNIEIFLYDSDKVERDECFQIELFEPDGGASLGKLSRCIITIVNDEAYSGLVSRIVNMTKCNLDALQLEKSTYVQQFYEAMNVNGGDLDSATFVDYVMHFLTFLWKILFAFIPPAQYMGGWPAFIVSLSVIGALTAIIGDLASIFGCLIGLKDSVTAITLVALGTSMPDTFASKQAALGEKTADSSVGNINGSNSVNVFLGLGLPWLMATVYWQIKEVATIVLSVILSVVFARTLADCFASQGKPFEVPTGNLGFTVILFTTCAVVAIVILLLRRFFCGGELGGPRLMKFISAAVLCFLWLIYVLLSSMQSYSIIDVDIGGG